MSSQLPADLQLQVEVSKLVGFGFGITLADRCGISAPLAVVFGLRARRLIKGSEVPLSGIIMAWWCILVGCYNSVVGAVNLLYLLAAFYQG